MVLRPVLEIVRTTSEILALAWVSNMLMQIVYKQVFLPAVAMAKVEDKCAHAYTDITTKLDHRHRRERGGEGETREEGGEAKPRLEDELGVASALKRRELRSVSYTHLTLPTILLV